MNVYEEHFFFYFLIPPLKNTILLLIELILLSFSKGTKDNDNLISINSTQFKLIGALDIVVL